MRKKVLRTTITLAGDEFDTTGSNVLIADKLRTSAVIRFGGGAVMPSADITIWGLNLDAMHKLMRIRWQDINSMMNRVKLEAGEAGEKLINVFEGNITFAYIDTSNAPEISLKIQSMMGVLETYKPANPISWQGEKSVVEAIQEIADRMGYILQNDGVPEDLVMHDVTLGETDLNKIRKLCKDYEIDLYVEHGLIAITPQGAPRKLAIPVLTPETGLIGYPVPTIQGIDVKCLWNPQVRFGGIIRVENSIMETTNGDWRAFGVTAHLESELNGGNWFMEIQASHREASNVAISR